MQHLKILLILCLSLSVFFGCATIVTKSTYPVNITTNPTNANISIQNRSGKEVYRGVSPTIVSLKASSGYFSAEDYSINVHKDGYDDTKAVLSSKIEPWYIFGNIFVGGLIGWVIIDPVSGAMWKLPSEFNIDMVKNKNI